MKSRKAKSKKRNFINCTLLSGAALLTTTLASPSHAFDIDTTGAWNGSTYISSWGVPNTATYGQTITADTLHANLQNITFYLGYGGGTPQYQAYVYQWNGTRITGPALYTSGILTAPAGNIYTPVTISTGGIALTPGQQYVVFFSTSTVDPNVSSAYRWGALTSNTTYSGGQFYFMNNGTDFSQLSSNAWSTIAEDLAMIITFDPVSIYPIVSAQGNTVALNAARVIDNHTNLYALFGGLSTERDVSNAVSQTLPLVTGGSMLATQSVLDNINGIIQTRTNSALGISSGDGVLGDKYFWVKPFGSRANQDDQGSVSGYTADTFGVVAGVDGRLSGAFRLGGA